MRQVDKRDHTDNQTNRQIDELDRLTHRQLYGPPNRQNGLIRQIAKKTKQTTRHIENQTKEINQTTRRDRQHRQIDKQRNRRIDTQTKQTNRQTHKQIHNIGKIEE